MTFAEARTNILNWFEDNGYEVRRNLKNPWARNRDKDVKIYFKTQSILKGNYSDNINQCRSLCSNMRSQSIAHYKRGS